VKRANDQKGTMETVQNEQAKCEDGQVNESSKGSCRPKIKAVLQKKKCLKFQQETVQNNLLNKREYFSYHFLHISLFNRCYKYIENHFLSFTFSMF